MDGGELRSRIAERYNLLASTRFPRGAARLPGVGDADTDLAELDGFVAGLASSFLQKAPLRVDRITLNRRLERIFGQVLPTKGDDQLLEPYRLRWRLIVELSELLAATGKLRVEWVD
jgi:hypothetical protein